MNNLSEIIKIENVANVNIGILKSRYLEKKDNNQFYKYKIIEAFDFTSYDIKKNINNFFNSSEILGDEYLLKENDIIIKLFPPFSFQLLTKEYNGYIVPSNIAIIRPKKIEPKILFYLLELNFEKLVNLIVGSTKLKTLNIKLLKNFKLKNDWSKNELNIKSDLNYLLNKLMSLLNKKKQIILLLKKFYMKGSE